MKFRPFLVIICAVLLLPSAGHAAGLTAALPASQRAAKASLFQSSSADAGPKAETGAPHTAISIAPHRAIYTMTLASAKNGSNITGVTGRMLFEWADACDGWAVQQHLQLHFIYAEGDESDVNSTVISWESKDGKLYNFNVRRMVNGKETENYRGRAVMGEHGGSGKYTIPKDKKDAELPAGTLFPSAHTVLILGKAEAGNEKLFTRRVFDGSDEEGQADVSAFIGARQEQKLEGEQNSALRDNPLLATPFWPVRLAFFSPKTETGEPDYEMNLVMHANGIARSMLIDYGDFAVSGVLSSLEAIPAQGCSQ
jgi:hypothetical protein